MFNLYNFIEERVRLKPTKNNLTFKIHSRIEIVILAIEEIQKKETKQLFSMQYSLNLQKERLTDIEKEKILLEENKIKQINYREEIDNLNKIIKTIKESIIKLNQSINLLIFKIITEIKNITEEIDNIIIELNKFENFYLKSLNLSLNQYNQILSKIKIKLNYTLENTLLEIKECTKELTNILDLLKKILKYKHEFDKADILELKK